MDSGVRSEGSETRASHCRTCASYAAQNPELIEEIYNSDGDASDGDGVL